MAPKFQMEKIGITSGAMQELIKAGHSHDEVVNYMRPLLWKHQHGEWGDVDKHDSKVNDQAVKTGARILSAHTLFGVKLWIISDAAWTDDPTKREVTTILRPDDY